MKSFRGARFIGNILNADEISAAVSYTNQNSNKRSPVHENGRFEGLRWDKVEFDFQPAILKIDQFLGLDCQDGGMRVLYFLDPGARIHPHRDYSGPSVNDRIRFHVPIITNPDVEFYVDKRRIVMLPGELWMLDTSYLHSVYNGGSSTRVHIVYEVEVNSHIRQFLDDSIANRIHVIKFFLISVFKVMKLFVVDFFKNPVVFKARFGVLISYIKWKFGLGHIQPAVKVNKEKK